MTDKVEREIYEPISKTGEFTKTLSDGSVYTRKSVKQGFAGLEDDIWVDTIAYQDGTKEQSTYTTTGSKTIVDFNGNAGDVRTLKKETINRDGTKNIATYSYNQGSTNPTINIKSYDTNGVDTGFQSVVEYKNDGSKHVTEYKNGVLSATKNYDSNGIFKNGYKETFDDVNHTFTAEAYFSEEDFSNGKYEWKQVQQNDSNGHEISSTTYDYDGEVRQKYVYEYDKNGKNTSVKWYDENGTLASETKYEYDTAGNKISEKAYDVNKNVTESVIYGYNANGKLISAQTYDANGNIEYEGVSDDNGKVVARRRWKNGELVSNDVAKEINFNGKVYTFNANELRSVAHYLTSCKVLFANTLGRVSEVCGEIAGTVSSYDSGLSSTLNKIVATCNNCKELINKLLDNLNLDIDNYITKTIQNEENANKELNDINSNLDDISNIFGNI